MKNPPRSRVMLGATQVRVARIGSAFTLLELMISVALMSLVLAVAYACMRSAFESRKMIEARSDALQNARVALDRLSADLRGACVLSTNVEFLGLRRSLGDRPADNLDFATHNYSPRRDREGDWCEVSYFVDRSRDGKGASLWRRRDATPDDEPLAGGAREELATGVRGLRFEYYDGWEWFETWGVAPGQQKRVSEYRQLDPNLSGLPEAVRVTLWLDASGQRGETNSSASKPSEPPLAFQTVARLNLATTLSTPQSSASSSSSPAQPSSGGSTRGGRP